MKSRIALLLTATLVAAGLLALAAPRAHAAVTTLNPVADSYVQADRPASNFGTATVVKVDGAPVTVSYLKFDVQGITGAPVRATLAVFVPVSTTTPINVRSVADTAWTETGLTFDNRPATGASAIASPAPIAANTTVSFDVTSLVTGPGLVSFALDTTSSTSKSLPSREATANQPQLAVDTGGGTTTTTTPPTTTTTPPPAGTPLRPVADSYVQADLPGSNFGTATVVKVDGAPVTVSYLKFDVQGITGAPVKATLTVFVPVSTTTPINVRSVADTAWTETGLTFDNRPATGASAIASPAPIAANTTVSFDVTSLVTGPGLVSFALDTTSSSSKSLPSREATANQPQLAVDTGGGTTTTTTPPTTTPPTTTTPPPTTTTPPPADSVVMAVAGDVACGTTEANYNGGAGTATACHMMQTADLIGTVAPQQVWALGDLQYNSGSLSDFTVSYQNSWGRFKDITKPAVGNHEYGTTGAGGYFTYFGDRASPRQPGCTRSCEGYYSFDVAVGSAQWHVAVINSECTRIGGGVGCAVGSPQHQWLDADLAAHATGCTAVLTHRPRWASNSFASPDIQPLVDVMDAHGVDLLLAGHAHSYERFAPQNAAGQADPAGIREFAVGTGGRDSQGFATVVPNSEVRKNKIFGVMKLTLRPTGYDWQYVPDPATAFADSGTGSCT